MRGQILKFDDSAHREVDELLPWFVNGTLEGRELAAVEQHVRECARCRREVALLQRLQAVCAIDVPAPDATPSYRRLHERIAGRRWLGSLRDRVLGLSRPWQRAPAWAKWAIAAEFAGIVMLAGRIAMPAGESAGLYQTLGAPAARVAHDGTVAVVFVPEATESELRRIVRAAGARVVDGPTESNAYVLEVPPGHRDAVLAVLRAESAVALAQPLTAQPDR
jgi:anti-sigma factor RsiW